MTTGDNLLAQLHEDVFACTRCVTTGHINHANPIAGARGRVRDRIMLIGQAPGRLSVERQLPFGGPGGQVLETWLTRAGFPPNFLRTDVYLTALTRCFPGKSPSGKGDRAPSSAEIANCREWLDREIAIVQPEVILLVGGLAIKAFLGSVPLDQVVGTSITQDDRLLFPLPHPSGVSHWLNNSHHQALLAQSLHLLATWREQKLSQQTPQLYKRNEITP